MSASKIWVPRPVLRGAVFRRSRGALPSIWDLPYRTLTQSGRAAIGLALQYCQVRPGDRVLVPTYHCPTMVAPIERLRSQPAFYPLMSDGRPDVERLAQLNLRGVRAAIAVHLFGFPTQMDEMRQFCSTHGIKLIEDCSHCFFGKSVNTAVGTSGDYAIGSLPKFFETSEGGILASHSPFPHRQGLSPRTMPDEIRAAWNIIDWAARSGGLGLIGGLIRQRAERLARMDQSDVGDQERSPQFSPDAVRDCALSDPALAPKSICRIDKWIVEHSDWSSNIERRIRNFQLICDRLADAPRALLLRHHPPVDSAPYVVPVLLENAEDAYMRMKRLHLPVFRWDRMWPGAEAIPTSTEMPWSRHLIQIACHQSLGREDCMRLADLVARSI